MPAHKDSRSYCSKFLNETSIWNIRRAHWVRMARRQVRHVGHASRLDTSGTQARMTRKTRRYDKGSNLVLRALMPFVSSMLNRRYQESPPDSCSALKLH